MNRTYHDAVFVGLRFDWKAEIAEIEFRFHEQQKLTMSVPQVKHVSVNKEIPWGHSVNVNDVSFEEDGHQVAIEMQSGDVIKICSKVDIRDLF